MPQWKNADPNFSPEHGDGMFVRNAGILRQVYTAPKPRRTTSILERALRLLRLQDQPQML